MGQGPEFEALLDETPPSLGDYDREPHGCIGRTRQAIDQALAQAGDVSGLDHLEHCERTQEIGEVSASAYPSCRISCTAVPLPLQKINTCSPGILRLVAMKLTRGNSAGTMMPGLGSDPDRSGPAYRLSF